MMPAPPAPPIEAREAAGVAAPSAPRKKNLKAILWAAIPLAVLVSLVVFDLPICPTRIFLGIPCPGCGLTRATEAMVMGDFGTMLRMHPLAPIIAPLAIWSLGRSVLVSAGFLDSTQLDPLRRVPSWAWAVLAFALIGLWVVRALGLLGGLPDPLDVTHGLLWRGVAGLWELRPG